MKEKGGNKRERGNASIERESGLQKMQYIK